MKDKTILVVGGAGYIGSHVNKMLRKEGYKTLVLDDFSRGSLLTIPNTPHIEGNLGNFSLLCKIFETHEISTVMHFAAFSNIGESFSEPAKYYLNNVAYTLNLLNAMIKYQITHLIFSSTAAIFGHPQQLPIDENHPCIPINPYGESKLMVEKLLRDYDHAYGLRSCSIRYFNAAGGDPEFQIKNYQSQISNLIPLVLKNFKAGEHTIKVNGTDYDTPDGTCIRDYIHIEDLGAAHLLGMQKLWETNTSCHYNLGIGKGYSVKEVLETIQTVTQKKIHIVENSRRMGDPAILIADACKARTELNWNPHYCELPLMIEHAWKALDYL